MFYDNFVRTTYAEAVRLHPTASSDLKRALKYNERVPSFIDNLAREFDKIAGKRIRLRQKMPDTKHLKEIVYDMVNVFIGTIEIETKKRYETDLEKAATKAKAAEAEALEKASEGVMTNEFEEMGLKTIDDRSST